MWVNESGTDRVIRLVLAIALGVLGFYVHGVYAWVSWIVAAIAAVTAATGFCGLYRLLGIRTCPIRKA